MFKNLFIIATLLLSFALKAELKIEKDIVFKTLISQLNETKFSKLNAQVFVEAARYRLDLTLADTVDQVALITSKKNFEHYHDELKETLKGDLQNYSIWYKKLNELANQDQDFKDKLNDKLYMQYYNNEAQAIVPEFKLISVEKLMQTGVIRRVTNYNKFVATPDFIGIRGSIYAHEEFKDFYHNVITVSKFKKLKTKSIRKVKRRFYRIYLASLKRKMKIEREQYGYRDLDYEFYLKRGRVNKKPIVANFRFIEEEEDNRAQPRKRNIKAQVLEEVKEIYNALFSVSNKKEILRYIEKDNNIEIEKVQGIYLLSPYFVLKYLEEFKESLKEYTFKNLMNFNDNVLFQKLRKWIKRNRSLIFTNLDQYNSQNNTQLNVEYKNPQKLPRRIEVIKSYETLELLFPDRPWLGNKTPDYIDSNGRDRFIGESPFKKMFRNLGRFLKSLTRLENLSANVLGTAVYIVSGGNMFMAMGVQSLTQDLISKLRYDNDIREFLLNAPGKILNSFLLGSGFSAGRIYKIFAMGAGRGAVQSLITGQDVRTGAIVGAALDGISSLLPRDLTMPLADGISREALRMNRWLELTTGTIRGAIRGSVTAALTGDSVWNGALTGSAYGASISLLSIGILGTLYDHNSLYTDEELNDMIDAENDFQNDVGRGGDYAITRDLMDSSQWRVNGLLPQIISASITLPGAIPMSDSGVNSLTTHTHEASHLMQQEQSGVFGFYLFRYIPTSFRTGYDGHPDENFLRRFLSRYL